MLSVLSIVVTVIITITNICGEVYQIWYLNVLESSFLLNLAIVTIAAINETSSHTYKSFLITSICISFILFIGIIIFHVYLRFSKGGSQETETENAEKSKRIDACSTEKKTEKFNRQDWFNSITAQIRERKKTMI